MSNTDDFLAHYGIKGMKWGKRKREDAGSAGDSPAPAPKPKGGDSTAPAPKLKGSAPVATDSMDAIIRQHQASKGIDHSTTEAQLRDYAIKRGADPALLAAKYGPSGAAQAAAAKQIEFQQGSFYQRHKTAINVGAGIAVAGLAAYGGNKLYQKHLEANGKVATGKFAVAKAKINLMNDYGMKDAPKKAAGNFDPAKLPTDPITLKAGTIVKRVSSENEKTPRANGFFAAHEPDDVERYKAIIPTFWPMWGINRKEGFVVNLKANQEIRAPSRKGAFDIYESMLLSGDLPVPKSHQSNPKAYAKDTFLAFSANWAGDQQSLTTTKYFNEVKKRGYNALVDENDAGSLSKNPMRYLDGTMFTTQPATILDQQKIKETQVKEAKKLKIKK